MLRWKFADVTRLGSARLIGRWTAVWLANMALWLLFAANFSLAELLAGAVVATVACVGAGFVQRATRIRFQPSAQMLMQAWRIPGDLFDGLKRIMVGLIRRELKHEEPLGGFEAMRFDCGGGDPKSAARRALAVTFVTITPNTVVLGFVPAQGVMLYHQFSFSGPPEIASKLGAKP